MAVLTVENGARPTERSARVCRRYPQQNQPVRTLPDLERNVAMDAKRALFRAGFELAGLRLQVFAERLVATAEASPNATDDKLVRQVMREVDDGALALMGDEPKLRDHRLARPAWSVSEAAESALYDAGRALLEALRDR